MTEGPRKDSEESSSLERSGHLLDLVATANQSGTLEGGELTRGVWWRNRHFWLGRALVFTSIVQATYLLLPGPAAELVPAFFAFFWAALAIPPVLDHLSHQRPLQARSLLGRWKSRLPPLLVLFTILSLGLMGTILGGFSLRKPLPGDLRALLQIPLIMVFVHLWCQGAGEILLRATGPLEALANILKGHWSWLRGWISIPWTRRTPVRSGLQDLICLGTVFGGGYLVLLACLLPSAVLVTGLSLPLMGLIWSLGTDLVVISWVPGYLALLAERVQEEEPGLRVSLPD